MSKKVWSDDLATAYREGRIGRRELMRRAGTLAAAAPFAGKMKVGAGLAAVGAGTALSPALLAAQEDATGMVTASDEQQATWIRNFNPFVSQGTCRWLTHHGIYEPLAVFNDMTAELVPWLANEWSFSDDNLTLTFNLRDDVLWSDGETMDADDVVFTWNALLEDEALTGNAGARAVAPYLDNVAAIDDYTVEFTFNTEYTIGLFDIAGQMVIPEHTFADVEDLVTYTNEEPVGTGPITEVARFESQIYEIRRNPNYWQEGLPLIEGIRVPAFPDNDSVNLATINGENDWAGNFIADIDNTFVAQDPEHFHYWFPPTGATVQVYLNTTEAPFDNVDVRRAFSYAINRDQIVQIAMYDYTHPADATGLSDVAESWKTEEALAADWTVFNVDRANELLDEAGLTMDGDVRVMEDGTPLQFDINVVSGWTDWVQSCEIIAQNLAEVGVQLTVRPYDFTAWLDRVQEGNFTVSIGWSSQGATPFNFYRSVMSSATFNEIGEVSGENWQRFVLDEADTLLDQFAATSDEAEQMEIAAQLQGLFVEHVPSIPLFPGPQWGQYNTQRFTGFPNEDNPYTTLSTYADDRLILINTIEPVEG